MNIVLIGYRGTGKSVVAGLLAKNLKMRCIGMDAEIVKKAAMPIPEIVEQYGWPKFRDLESDIAQDLANLDNIIIDTGGGVIERAENMDVLRRNAIIIWLQASVDIIVSRIHSDAQRPALTSGKTFTEEVAEVLEQRTAKYKNSAQYEINTDDLNPEQITDEIMKIWNS